MQPQPQIQEPAAETAAATTNQKFQFAVPVHVLREAVTELKKVCRSNATLPVLATVLIERTEGTTRFTATDLDRWLSFTLPSDIPPPTSDLGKQLQAKRSAREDGKLCVPIKTLSDAIKYADKAADITFSSSASSPSLSYSFGGNKAVLDWEPLDASEFPPPISVGEAASFPLSEAVKSAMIACLPNATDDEQRYILLSVFLDTKNNTVVATDGRSVTSFATPLPQIGQLVVPKDAVHVLAGKMSKLPWTIAKNTVDAPLVQFRAGNWTLTTKLIDGDYPNWRQVVPPIDDKTQVAIPLTVFSRSEIADLLKRLPKDPKSEHDPVKLRVHKDSLSFSVGESAFTVKIAINIGRTTQIRTTNANRKFWQRLIELGATELRFENELSPIAARSRHGLTFVFMPIRITS